MENATDLRRYTNLPSLIDTLMRRQITLGGYAHWVDANDRRAMRLYQETLHYGFVGAMCLTRAAETFHHWEIFAGGTAGVCIVFKREAFEQAFRGRTHFMAKPMEYTQLTQIGTLEANDIHRLPFLKREGFRDEREFRLLGYTVESLSTLSAPLHREMVSRVIVSPFVHKAFFDSIQAVLRKIEGWSDLPIQRSSLTDNDTWQAALTDFVARHGSVYSPWMEFDAEQILTED